MKLTNMLLSSQTLGHGSTRHFSDGDFALRFDSRGGQSYVDSLRLRRPATRSPRSGVDPLRTVSRRPAGTEKRGFWSFLR